MRMVWRKTVVWAAFIGAACGGESIAVDTPGGAGEAGAAGAEDGALAHHPGTGGSVVGTGATGGSMPASTGGGGSPQDGGSKDSPDTGTAGRIDPDLGAAGAVTTDPDPDEPNEETPPDTVEPSEPEPATTCALQSITIQPDITPTDQCDAAYTCDGERSLRVTCDGENDGTNTSLCTCYSGARSWHVSGVVQGEAPESCNNASDRCLAQWPTG